MPTTKIHLYIYKDSTDVDAQYAKRKGQNVTEAHSNAGKEFDRQDIKYIYKSIEDIQTYKNLRFDKIYVDKEVTSNADLKYLLGNQ